MHYVTLFVQISRHSSKLGQMEVELVSLKYAQVAFGAKKSTMVLFCRKSGKLDLQRKRVATTAKAKTRREKRAMTRNMRGFFPTTQGTAPVTSQLSSYVDLSQGLVNPPARATLPPPFRGLPHPPFSLPSPCECFSKLLPQL